MELKPFFQWIKVTISNSTGTQGIFLPKNEMLTILHQNYFSMESTLAFFTVLLLFSLQKEMEKKKGLSLCFALKNTFICY